MKKKIIYIIGSGRSGTTLLDILLGNEEGIFSGGELTRYALRQGVPTGFNNNPERTKFWRGFTDKFAENINFDVTEALINDFEYYNVKGVNKLLSPKRNKARYREYCAFLTSFFEYLFGQIEEDVIVDSSKYPKRAINLSKCLDQYDLCYIYIKRNPAGVVKSFAKTDVYIPPKNWLNANIYYFVSNILCTLTVNRLKKKHKVVTVKYEDLVAYPAETLDKIAAKFDIDFTSLKKKLKADEPLKVGDLFEGNSMRIKSNIKLKRTVPKYPSTFVNIFTRIFNFPIYR